MCMTEYIKERAQSLEKEALAKIAIVDDLIYHITLANARALDLPRAGATVALLCGIHADLVGHKAACMHVIAEVNAIQRESREVSA
jgi:hypothetical protein